MKFTKLNYCQYLLSSQINYTLTNLAKHLEVISHDKINRYLKNEKLTPSLLPTERIISLPTIYLKILRLLYNRCARFVGRLKSFTGN
jgi:hypothetical protein